MTNTNRSRKRSERVRERRDKFREAHRQGIYERVEAAAHATGAVVDEYLNKQETRIASQRSSEEGQRIGQAA